MSFLKQKHLLLATLALQIQAQPTTTFITQNTTQLIIYISSIFAITALSLFIFYDRRHNYHYLGTAITAITGIWAAFTNRIKRMRGKKEANEKLGTEDQISDKPTMGFIQTDKSYIIEADLASIQQTANTNSSLPDELKQTTQEEEPSAPVNLKQVFGKKEKKEGNRSRSKLKNRVQIKKSELEDQQQEEIQAASQDLENSLDNSEG